MHQSRKGTHQVGCGSGGAAPRRYRVPQGPLLFARLLATAAQAGVKALVDEAHGHGLPVIYRGFGNVECVFEDLIEIGIDAHDPLEAKAGLDVVKLRRRYGHRIGFCGNMNVITWAQGTDEEIRAEVLTKLNAAKGGGYIFQSDHSVPGDISARNHEYGVRQFGRTGDEFVERHVPQRKGYPPSGH